MENKIIKNILRGFKKISYATAKHCWLCALIILFFIALITNFIFYKYYILNKDYSSNAQKEEKIVLLNEKKYEDFLRFWVEQNIRNQNINSKIYLNIFDER